MKIRLFDAHADTPFELWRKDEAFFRNDCHIDAEKAGAFSEYRQVFAYCSLAGSKWALSERDFQNCYQQFLEKIASQSVVKPYFSIEGPEIINFDPQKLAQMNFSVSTLTWNADNVLAGCHFGQRGLSERGIDYVHEAQSLGVIIDVSHLSEVAFWDLMRITKKPICASHSNCRAIWDHTRNLTDDQLRAIADTDGVVGLNLYVDFLGETADFETLRRHLEHMLHLCGEKNVCLGGDLDGCDTLPKGFQNVASYVDFYDYLQSCGYGSELLDRIFYSNLMRLF